MSVKTSVAYRSPDNIQNLKIRIKIKNQEATDKEEVKVFAWQQKCYSKFEIEFYKERENCSTDLEKKYHDEVVDLIYNDETLFSYIHEDKYDLECSNIRESNDATSVKQETENKSEFVYEESLTRAMNDAYSIDTFEVMYLMADLGEYYENKWLKSEHILCTIKYNYARKYLLLYPDFTSDKPYVIKSPKHTYIYYVEDASDKMPIDLLLKENEILNKVSSHGEKSKLHGMGDAHALTSAESVLNVHLLVEILCGKKFENNSILVKYYIDLPNDYSTGSNLNGSTFTCYSSNYKHHFGYPFEISLQYNLNSEVQQAPPYIYFEVVSKDFWNCFCIEGLAYTALPVFKPGYYHYNLQCLRICPDSPLGNLRRYFLGEYPGYSDITWCSIPKDYDKKVLNKYGVNTISTGELGIRINVLHQSHNINQAKQYFVTEKLKMSTLAKSIEHVLEAFNDAKRKMIEARKNV